MDMKGFSELILDKNQKFNDHLGFEICENRGDTYLKYGHFSKGIDDYKRAIRMCPDCQIYRWKYVVSNSNAKGYLDIKTVERPKKANYKFWLKYEYPNAKPKQISHTLENTVIDCDTKRINTLSHIEYDTEGKVVSSRDMTSGWATIIPDTIGEILYKGWCNN